MDRTRHCFGVIRRDDDTRLTITNGGANPAGIASDRRDSARSRFQKRNPESLDVDLVVHPRRAEVDGGSRVSLGKLVVAHRTDEADAAADTLRLSERSETRHVMTLADEDVAQMRRVALQRRQCLNAHDLPLERNYSRGRDD